MAFTTIAMSHVLRHTTIEERTLLKNAGFVHVTGLVASSFASFGNSDKTPIGHDLRPRDLGRSGYNNGMFAIITEGAEVWIAKRTGTPLQEQCVELAVRKLCPNGCDAWVPCSNGDLLTSHDLLGRIADSDYSPKC